jgi:hypothetical protein
MKRAQKCQGYLSKPVTKLTDIEIPYMRHLKTFLPIGFAITNPLQG